MFNLLARIDDFLLDRVFQPVVDACARWTTPAGIAGFLLTGAVLGKIGLLVGFHDWFAIPALAFPYPALFYLILRAERTTRNTAPITRHVLTVWRWMIIIFEPFMFLVALTSHDSDGPIAGLLLNSSQWLTDVAVFVLSCRKNPPKPRRVWQLLGRLLPNPT